MGRIIALFQAPSSELPALVLKVTALFSSDTTLKKYRDARGTAQRRDHHVRIPKQTAGPKQYF